MNIFIDTSALYRYPFWNGNYSKQILKAAQKKRINIYVSRVVIDELRRHYNKQLKQHIRTYKSALDKLFKITGEKQEVGEIALKKLQDKFDHFYEDNSKNGYINIIEVSDSTLHNSLFRAIQKIKPYSENRNEFKDSVIWLSYVEFAKQNDLYNCVFITKNTRDFASNNSKNKLHERLLEDHSGFKLNTSFDSFFHNFDEFFHYPKEEFQNWLEEQEVDADYILDLFSKYPNSNIELEIENYISDMDLGSISGTDFLEGISGYANVTEVVFNEINDIEIDTVGEYALISGDAIIGANIDLYGSNNHGDSYYQKEPRHPYYGFTYFECNIKFTFKFNTNKKIQNFEINDIYI